MVSRAQGAIEYLLIIGAAILVVAIVVVLITVVSSQGKVQVGSGMGFSSSVGSATCSSASSSVLSNQDKLKLETGNYFRLNGILYRKNTPLVYGAPALDYNFIGLWHMDETSGSILYDSTNKNNNARINAGSITSTSGRCVSKGISFNGTTYFETDGVIGVSGSMPRTVSVWFYPTAQTGLNGNGVVLVRFGDRSFNGTEFLVGWAGNASPPTNQNIRLSGYNQDVYCYALLNLNNWYNVVEAYDSTIGRIYLNGVECGVNNISLSTTSTKLSIGRGTGNWDNFIGTIDEVAVWSRALNEKEIQTLYADATR